MLDKSKLGYLLLFTALVLCLWACGSKVMLYRWNSFKITLFDKNTNQALDTLDSIAVDKTAFLVKLNYHQVSDVYSSGLGPHPQKVTLSNDKISEALFFIKGKRTDNPLKDTLNISNDILAAENLTDEPRSFSQFMKTFGNYNDNPKSEFYIFLMKQPPVKNARLVVTFNLGVKLTIKDSTKILRWKQ